MKERPILFNSNMVRALLDGRKTQTRRVVKPASEELIRCHAGEPGEEEAVSFIYDNHLDDDGREHGPEWLVYADECPEEGVIPIGQCPYGKRGDRLWVRETWGVVSHAFDANGNRSEYHPDRPATPVQEMPFGQGYYHGHVIYAADGGFEWAGDDDGGGDRRSAWKPSIHMPRIASRITLEIVSVRVERLQDINEEDAKAEGVNGEDEAIAAGLEWFDKPRRAFRFLWQSINGAESWDANPWVWVVEFKRVEQ